MNLPAQQPPRIHGDIAARGAALDFAVNVAATTPSWLINALSSQLSHLAAYPDATKVAEVEAAIAAYHTIPPEHVMLLAGAAEGFALLPTLSVNHPTIIHPGFAEPDITFTTAGRTVHRIILLAPFRTLPPINHPTDLIMIGNPTNPTGVLWNPTDLAALAQPGRFLVVDEAFMDIVGEEHSIIPHVPTNPQIIVLRSLTKTWALAGLRVGYMVADPDTVLTPLRQRRAHWPVGTLQIAAAEAVFNRGVRELPARRQEMQAQRAAMLAALGDINWLPVSESHAPFVLVRPGERTPAQAKELYEALLAQGIALRRCDTFPGLGWNYFRLAVRKTPQVESLITELRSMC
ncbi:MAG: Rv2231c family pyridoxal phosphate-dependent protein CobC [Corynebacterium sp.]|nr:Rv2231c family pyridoxal phosphate-dependent protein CobC [Corynebacterium sp.]